MTDASTAETPERSEAPLAARAQSMFVPRLMRLSAAVAAGLMVCLSFPPFGWWYLAFVAFALLAWVMTHESTTAAGGLGYGFLFGLAFFVPLLPWISGLVGAFPWLMLAALEASFPALFGLLAVIVRRLPGWPVWFAGVWTLTEWLKSTVPFGGFPWGVIGFSQDDSPLLALAQWGGAPLVSFAVTAVGFSLAALLIGAARRWGSHDQAAGVLVPGLCIVVVLLSVAMATPQLRKSGAGAGEDDAVTVAVVQGNVPRLGLEFNAQRRAVLDNHVGETMRLAQDVREGRAPQPDVVIWPENSSDIDPLANQDAASRITAAVEAIRAPILVGAVVAGPGYSTTNPESTNSVIVWTGPGQGAAEGPGERHDKKIVQPFGEYLPWRGFFRLLSSYADRAGYFVPGDGDGVVQAAGMSIGVTTCWEVIFDRAARESVLNGAQFLVVPSNNATFDEAMSAQQLAFGRLRAVEHDRYVVVAGTVGISAVIAPDGRVLARTEFFEPAYLDTQIRLKSSLTPATRWAPIVQLLLVGVGLAAVAAAMLHNGVFSRRRTATDAATDEGVK